MPRLLNPRYILTLDDLPKIIEADGVVYPVYLPIKDAARLFGVTRSQIMTWHLSHALPLVLIGANDAGYGGKYLCNISELNGWISRHSVKSRSYE